ncbi:hypothetical protein [Gracilinema caldarium]|uniref:YD repeat-containing protein n=1 Tax=Gracilinema caldarium (strain ATCC 51460 / DSM 7334 / H1) TaxID=744872 RepID=F8EY11_GRAC1|nr:hypothetical protein [Gracilinema caldarium]AEJ20672.1 hypothetical protein Spica_2571 [Gracilinema caldarium DSM 7334]
MKYRVVLACVCVLFLSCTTNQVIQKDDKGSVQEKSQVNVSGKLRTVEIQVPKEIKSITKFSDGSVDEYTITTWDNTWKYIQNQRRYSASGAVLETTEFVYEKNLLVGKTIKDREDKVVSRRSYMYTPAGLLSSEVIYDANGKLVSAFEYVYDAQNNKILWIVKDANNSKVAETKYIYKNGKVQSAELYDTTGKKNGSSSYEYDSEGHLYQVSYFNGLGTLLRKELSYWEKGVLVKEERTNVGGQVLQRISYEYGPYKELVKKTVEDLQGKSKQTVVYEYTIRTETRIAE